MINYGYFRHRFDAHTNPKLNELADEIGIAAFGYYYTLVELYGAKYVVNKDSETVEIHARTIANVWRKRADSCHKVMTKLQLSGLLVFTKHKNTYQLSIPNFLKYYGSYKKKEDNKPLIKENKIKENKNLYIGPDDIVQLWNDEMVQHGLEHCRGLGSGDHLKNFIEACQFLKTKESWLELFNKCLEGNIKTENWKLNLTWLVNYDNALKILNGNFVKRKSNNEYKDFLTKTEEEIERGY